MHPTWTSQATVGGGAVARDSCGWVLLSACLSTGKCSSPTESEAAAVLGGLLELAKIFRGKVIIEIDSSSVR